MSFTKSNSYFSEMNSLNFDKEYCLLRPKDKSASLNDVITTTFSLILTFILSLLTLTALYQGISNIPRNSNSAVDIKFQVFLCLMIPLIVLYFSQSTLFYNTNSKKKKVVKFSKADFDLLEN